MASSSEIEKLERRCAENPHGLTFAPLAEAYRKHGDLDRALEVLRAGRELHPDYIPASIVLGRCQLDRGDLPEAERAFAHVLTLDPENVIALKALAELAEREGRSVQAERWLNLLLAVDPSNEEAREQLDRIREAGTPEALAAPEAAPQAVVQAIEDPADEPPLEPQPSLEPFAEAAPSGDDTAVGGEDAPDSAVAGADEAPYEPMHAVMSADSDLDVSVEVGDDIVLTPAADSDYRTDTASALPEVSPADRERVTYPFEEEEADTGASGLEPVPDLMSEWDGSRALEHDAASEPEVLYYVPGDSLAPVVTESMAELYLRQGHRSEALQVYRELLDRRPDDGRLAAIVDDLAAEVDAPAPAAPAYAASATGGRSVGELLRSVLAERLPPAPPSPEFFAEQPAVRAAEEVLAEADDQGEPTRPADDHLTLGAVFGEDESAAPPAVAAGTNDLGPADGGISFDEFFGPPPAEEPDATRAAPPPPAGNPDDLDQFHAWLQSLKR